MTQLNQQATTRIADLSLRDIRQTLTELVATLANQTHTPLDEAQRAIEQALLTRTITTTDTYWQQVYAARANGDAVTLTQLKHDFAIVFPDATPLHLGESHDR